MIHIITGSINCGKTTKLINIQAKHHGDGFFLEKVFREGVYVGQNIICFSTRETLPFSIKQDFRTKDWDEEEVYQDYSFSKKGMAFAKRIMDQMLEKHVSPLYLDEIGPLELEHRGFHEILIKCLTSHAELYLVVRSQCLDGVLRQYGINHYD